MSNLLIMRDLFFTPSMVYGPLRIILLVIFIFLVNKLVSKKSSNQSGLNYFIPRYVAFVSVVVLLSLALTTINAYDAFTILAILLVCVVIIFLNLNGKSAISKQLIKIRRRTILYTIRNLEQGKDLISTINFKKTQQENDTDDLEVRKTDYLWQMGIVVVIAVLTYLSRYYFFYFDTFALSDLWYEDFAKIKNLTNQQWFNSEGVLMGEYALIQLYGSFTSISDVIALQTFGLLENAVLGVVIYWTISQCTNTNYVPGLVAAFVFMFFYGFLPLNINLMTQHKPTFLALSLALPVFVYLCKPKTLRKTPSSYFLWMLCFFCGIAFIDFFTTIWVLPVFFIAALITVTSDTRKYYLRALVAYVLALLLFTTVYWISFDFDLDAMALFIKANTYSLKAYTYVPQLIVSLSALLGYYQVISVLLLIIAIITNTFIKRSLKNIISLLVMCCVFFCLPLLQIEIIDTDLLYQVIAVCIPLFMGVSVYLIITIINSMLPPIKTPIYVRIIATVIPLIIAYAAFQKSTLQNIPPRNLTSEYIMEAYDALDDELLPYSFTVVNTGMALEMSKDHHFFMTYDDFTTSYEQADALYVTNRNNKSFFKKYPEATLSKSMFVFVYEEKAQLSKSDRLKINQQQEVSEVITRLQDKGRVVRVFVKKPLLTVYEIVNEPKATKINDLLF